MTAKKKIVTATVDADSRIRTAIERAIGDAISSDEILKDIALVEAALETDKIIISLDENARHAFSELAQQIPELRTIVWINPANPSEQAIAWLQQGANRQKLRLLGSLQHP
jgi:hypothetical protein